MARHFGLGKRNRASATDGLLMPTGPVVALCSAVIAIVLAVILGMIGFGVVAHGADVPLIGQTPPIDVRPPVAGEPVKPAPPALASPRPRRCDAARPCRRQQRLWRCAPSASPAAP